MEIFKKRVRKFQDLLKKNEIDGTVIRTLSTYTYFTGVRWLRPALLLPSHGEPIAIVVKGEEELFREKSWIENIMTYRKAEDLMAIVTKWIRSNGYKKVGLEFSVERDSYILFLEVFKKLNPNIEIIDIRNLSMELRMIKDDWEIENIKKAGKLASKAMEVASDEIEIGKSELEIASEIYKYLMMHGSEEPKIYVSATPRIHAEPFRDVKVRDGKFVTIVIGADFNHYYANIGRSFFIGRKNERVKNAINAIEIAHKIAIENTLPRKKFIEVEREIESIYKKMDLQDYYITGYAHGVGLTY